MVTIRAGNLDRIPSFYTSRTAMHAMPFSNMLTFSSIDEFLSHVRMRDNGTAVLSVFLYVALR